MTNNKNNITQWMKKHYIVSGIIIFFLFISIIGVFIPTPDYDAENIKIGDVEKYPETNKINNNVGVGEEGRLYIEGSYVVPVCVTKEYLNELIDVSVARDEIGYRELLMSPKCYTASTIDDYGKVLVIDNKFGIRKFRFIHPDAIHYGEAAWTNYEFIIK